MNQPQDPTSQARPEASQPTAPQPWMTPAEQPPPYGTAPGPAAAGYRTAPGPPPGYGAPGQSGAGYGAPGQSGAGYGAPGQSGAGYGAPGQSGPGYGAPAGQAYQNQGYPQPGSYPGYPQPSGFGQPHPAYSNPVMPKDPALAEWWRRLLARLIDGIVLSCVLGLVLAPLWVPPWTTFLHSLQNIVNQYPGGLSGNPAATTAMANAEATFIGKILYIVVLFYIGAFAYDWIQHALWGQTIGKRALRTMVVTVDGRGKISAGAAGGRAAIYALVPGVPVVGGLFALVNELWLTWDPRRQCLHDKAAHTVVIKKDYQSSYPQAGGW